MAALIFSLVGAVILSGLVWVLFGSRLKLAKEPVQNDIFNVTLYLVCAFVLMLPLVLFLVA
ncbi:MAG: hypothetical protein F4W92_10030 [Gammaproteobacteria bacterium]|nr:hypothetical protein [Gammaproteobacteria bacterium]